MAEFGLSEQDLKDAQHLEKLYSFMKDNKNCAKCSSKGVTHINPSSGELVCGSCAPGVSGKRVGDTRFSDSEFAKIEKRYGKKGGSKEKPKAEKKKKPPPPPSDDEESEEEEEPEPAPKKKKGKGGKSKAAASSPGGFDAFDAQASEMPGMVGIMGHMQQQPQQQMPQQQQQQQPMVMQGGQAPAGGFGSLPGGAAVDPFAAAGFPSSPMMGPSPAAMGGFPDPSMMVGGGQIVPYSPQQQQQMVQMQMQPQVMQSNGMMMQGGWGGMQQNFNNTMMPSQQQMMTQESMRGMYGYQSTPVIPAVNPANRQQMFAALRQLQIQKAQKNIGYFGTGNNLIDGWPHKDSRQADAPARRPASPRIASTNPFAAQKDGYYSRDREYERERRYCRDDYDYSPHSGRPGTASTRDTRGGLYSPGSGPLTRPLTSGGGGGARGNRWWDAEREREPVFYSAGPSPY